LIWSLETFFNDLFTLCFNFLLLIGYIGLNLGLWIRTKINTYLSFNHILIWAVGYVLRFELHRMRGPDSFLYLYLKQRLILIVRSLQESHARINIRVVAILWLFGQWKLQDSCWWRRRRLRPPFPDQEGALASSHHEKTFHGVWSTIDTVNNAAR
jgi:hypothetical protein